MHRACEANLVNLDHKRAAMSHKRLYLKEILSVGPVLFFDKREIFFKSEIPKYVMMYTNV